MTKTAPSCRCGSWYRDNELERVSGTHWTALARLTREFHPLRVSQVALFACDGSRPFRAASTLGLRLDNRISPICGSSPPDQPRPVCARMAALPIPPFSKWGHGLLNSRTAFLSDAYRTYPMDLFNYRAAASPHKPAEKSVGLCRLAVGVKSPLILRGISARSSFSNKLLSLLILLVFE